MDMRRPRPSQNVDKVFVLSVGQVVEGLRVKHSRIRSFLRLVLLIDSLQKLRLLGCLQGSVNDLGGLSGATSCCSMSFIEEGQVDGCYPDRISVRQGSHH